MKTSRFRPPYFQGPLSGLDWALLSIGWAQWRSQRYYDGGEISHGMARGRLETLLKMKTSHFVVYFTFEGSLSGLDWVLLSLCWATEA